MMKRKRIVVERDTETETKIADAVSKGKGIDDGIALVGVIESSCSFLLLNGVDVRTDPLVAGHEALDVAGDDLAN